MAKRLKPKMKMGVPIVFPSRYGTKRTITQIGANLYHLAGKTEFIRASSDPTDPKLLVYIDFEGGPDYSVAELFPNPGGSERIIKIIQLEPNDAGETLIEITTKSEEPKHG